MIIHKTTGMGCSWSAPQMNLLIMNPDEVIKYFRPTTEREEALLEKLKELGVELNTFEQFEDELQEQVNDLSKELEAAKANHEKEVEKLDEQIRDLSVDLDEAESKLETIKGVLDGN